VRLAALLSLSVLGFVLGGGCDSSTNTPRCTTSTDCAGGRVCADGRCVIGADTGSFDADGLDGSSPALDGSAGDASGSTDAPVGTGEDVLIITSAPDEDDDFISDAQEGRSANVDSDRDGVADYRDLDSDGDGIFDRVEVGDMNYATPPADSDGDGIADFRDLDSDGNGVLDGIEGGGDLDGDGRINSADLDNDGDGLLDREEVGASAAAPRDTDGDGIPDMNEVDSDDDTISDAEEDLFDTDDDGLRDGLDLDSDGDGWTDAVEAGDASIATRAVDTDLDGIPDYRDADSDGDGISDAAERGYGTSRTLADTDGDGVSDLIEIGAGTSPTDGSVSPRTRGDFVFVVPYLEPPSPTRDTLSFRTSIQFADVYFLFDRSGSMDDEIGALRTAVSTVIGNLTCTDFGVPCTSDAGCGGGQVCSIAGSCISDPLLDSCVPSVWTGGGWYLDQYTNVLSLQPNPAATSTALSFGTTGGTESLFLALTRLANGGGVGCTSPLPADRIGCPAFRRDAVRIAVAFTDEDSDGGTLAAAASALSTAGITLIGIWSGGTGDSMRNALRDVVRDSGSLDRSGSPLVFNGVDSAVVPVVVNAINEIVEGVPLRATIEASDEPGDAGDALQFIDHLETNTTSPGCAAAATIDTNADGFPDAFPAVTPGTGICWDVVARMNTTVAPTLEPQIYRARLTVRGDGSPLDDRIVYFLVPPRVPAPGT
jgi:hypothetical protein